MQSSPRNIASPRPAALLKRLFTNEVFSDYFKIGFVQALNYLVPLVIIPFLVRVIGKENFGMVAYSQAFATYFLLVINYSFDFTATREVAQLNGDRGKINRIFNEVLQTKLFFFLFSALIFALLVGCISSFRKDAALHTAFFLSNFGFVLYQSWLFQGERIFKVAVVLNVLSKLVMAAGVFLFLKGQKDYYLYAYIVCISQLVLGILSIIYLRRRYGIFFRWQGLASIFQTIRRGAAVFFSNIFTNLSTTTNLFILSFFGSLQTVANYAAGSKLLAVVANVVIASFTITAFPFIAKKLSHGEQNGHKMIQYNAWLCLFFGVAVSLTMLVTSEWVIVFIFGPEFKDAIHCYRILCLIPIPLFLNNVFVVQGMLNLQMDKVFFKLTAVSASFSIILNFVLAHYYQDLGTAMAWLSTETLISITSFFILSRQVRLFQFASLKQLTKLSNA